MLVLKKYQFYGIWRETEPMNPKMLLKDAFCHQLLVSSSPIMGILLVELTKSSKSRYIRKQYFMVEHWTNNIIMQKRVTITKEIQSPFTVIFKQVIVPSKLNFKIFQVLF